MLGRSDTVVARIGTGPAHLARRTRAGVRLACRPTPVDPAKVTVMGQAAWLTARFWRHCPSCKARAAKAHTDRELFA